MKLPEEFTSRMKRLLGDEYPTFLSSYDEPRNYGLRVNTLKVSVEDFKKISPFTLEPVPWAKEGFYISEEDRPAKHPYYHAGLYYVQEPSAMVSVSALEPQPGDRVLDLCAAPGGKSTQIAARLAGKGVLFSNDTNNTRIRALVRNLELFGARNHVVLNDTPAKIATHFPGFFDKIVIDAPCSGEGMFRKDAYAIKSWNAFSVEKCTNMQKSILKHVSSMLKPGGTIVYSTCTFAPEENEAMIEYLLKQAPELEVKTITTVPGIAPGQPNWAEARPEISQTGRLWPHKIRGEGHFVALLQKKDGEEGNWQPISYPVPDKATLGGFEFFVNDSLTHLPEGRIAHYNSRLYMLPDEVPELKGLKVIRPGWYLGEVKKDRFKPSLPLALGLKLQDAKRILNYSKDDPNVIRYLKGETLNITGEKGWTLVGVDGFPLGWAKQLQDMLNNYYSAGWRWMD